MADPMQQARELLAAEIGAPVTAGSFAGSLPAGVHADVALRAITAALRSAPEGFVMVPVEPSIGVLASMAIRRDHGLGCPGYYDAPVFGAENVGHQCRMEVAIGEARQQYAEVVGKGFYSLDREGHYAGLAARPQGVR
ncbi:hypothetical protein [Stenotrophomonas nitritireducens]|nr:hypothetical protein [Stenotrophomonas nitritireducens]